MYIFHTACIIYNLTRYMLHVTCGARPYDVSPPGRPRCILYRDVAGCWSCCIFLHLQEMMNSEQSEATEKIQC